MRTRLDESRDTIVCLDSTDFTSSNVRDETLIRPCRGADAESRTNQMCDKDTGLATKIYSELGEILVRGFWKKDADCIVDVRIYNVNQKSHLTKNPSTIIKNEEAEKKRKHLNSCLEQRRNFTPFVVSCEGMMGR